MALAHSSRKYVFPAHNSSINTYVYGSRRSAGPSFIDSRPTVTMDLLASLHLDVLPEQQTRTSHPSVSVALESNPDVRLGFDACCHCAKPLQTTSTSTESSDIKKAAKPCYCKGCRRVAYCSSECRAADASAAGQSENEEGGGHGSVVCALLRLCDKDEAIDEGEAKEQEDDEAARDRVRSEFESYPATLANVLSSAPCYQSVLSSKRSESVLNVHVIGASEGVELWGDYRPAKGEPNVEQAYADALCDLAETNKLSINIHFVGPDCPEKKNKMDAFEKLTTIEKGGKQMQACLMMESHRSNYDDKFLTEPPSGGGFGRGPIASPDVVVFFNPGFTCPDYSWDGALKCIASGTPFLVTTNTEMEGIADCQYLFEKGFIASLPPMIRDIIEGGGGSDDEETDVGGDDYDDNLGDMYFGENPFAGSRVRQSGNMANDLFVKNRWMFGGIFGGVEQKTSSTSTSKKRKEKEEGGDGDEESPKKKKKKKKKCKGGNTKKLNPALI